MKRAQGVLVGGVAAVLVVACTSMVEAQPGAGGRGGRPGGGFGIMAGGDQARLLAREDVRDELMLLEDQIEQLQGLRDDIDMRSVFEGLRDVPREERGERMREAMQQVQEKIQAKIDEVLLPHQQKRLRELTVQFNMAQAVRRGGIVAGPVAEQLGISEEQGEQLREKSRELRRELEKKLQAELIKQLTPSQQAKLKELMGKPFTFEQESNPRFGPRGDDGRRRGPGGMGGAREFRRQRPR